MTYTGTVRNGTQSSSNLPPSFPTASRSAWRCRRKRRKASFSTPVRSLRDDADLEELYLRYKIQRGIRQADAGETMSQREAREVLRHWLE